MPPPPLPPPPRRRSLVGCCVVVRRSDLRQPFGGVRGVVGISVLSRNNISKIMQWEYYLSGIFVLNLLNFGCAERFNFL
jgi:hypothetical protein